VEGASRSGVSGPPKGCYGPAANVLVDCWREVQIDCAILYVRRSDVIEGSTKPCRHIVGTLHFQLRSRRKVEEECAGRRFVLEVGSLSD